MDELIERLRTEEGRRVAKWTTTPTQNPPMKYANREDVRVLLREAAAALEAAREDAERYRWLRDGGLGYIPYDDHGCGPEYPHHEELDAAIDQARGKGGGEVE